jgi:hypothetical protein
MPLVVGSKDWMFQILSSLKSGPFVLDPVTTDILKLLILSNPKMSMSEF